MQATRIIAIRHGETAWNVDTRIQGQLNVELNETGRWQAGRVAKALVGERIAAIYASDLLRAWETARSIADATAGPLHAHEGLRERGFGVFQGKTFSEIEATWPEHAMTWRKRQPDWAPPEGGESLLTMRERVNTTVTALAAQHLGQQIVVVTHGGVLDMLYRAATRLDLQAPRSWTLGNAAINRLLWTPEGFTLVGWSDGHHLEQNARDETHT
jgi:probable phosphoglycerate mutase